MKWITSIVFAIFLFSCNRPECTNNNPIFNEYNIESYEYKQELIEQLQKVEAKELSYWFYKYSKIEDKEYISVYVQGDELCAKIHLKVVPKENDKLKYVRKVKGKAYGGAEITGLTFDIVQKEKSIEFIYKDLEKIID